MRTWPRGDDGDQQLLDDVALADHRLGDLVAQPLQDLGGVGEGGVRGRAHGRLGSEEEGAVRRSVPIRKKGATGALEPGDRRGEAVPVRSLQRAHRRAQRDRILARRAGDRLGAFTSAEESGVACDRAARFLFERTDARLMQGRAAAGSDEGGGAPHLFADRAARPRRVGDERAETGAAAPEEEQDRRGGKQERRRTTVPEQREEARSRLLVEEPHVIAFVKLQHRREREGVEGAHQHGVVERALDRVGGDVALPVADACGDDALAAAKQPGGRGGVKHANRRAADEIAVRLAEGGIDLVGLGVGVAGRRLRNPLEAFSDVTRCAGRDLRLGRRGCPRR